jgi:hypothetical protein
MNVLLCNLRYNHNEHLKFSMDICPLLTDNTCESHRNDCNFFYVKVTVRGRVIENKYVVATTVK